MTNNFGKGDQVIITTREGKILNAIFSHKCPNGKGYVKAEDGRSYEREFHNIKKVGEASTNFELNAPDAKEFGGIAITTPRTSKWDINQKFDFLSHLTRMVINATQVSLIITGEGGLGKTYTVKKEILKKQLSNMTDYVIIKGFSTPRGLFRTLFENNGKLIVFDDCDEVLEDKIAKNLLKGALDSYDTREISWITKTTDESLPDSFEFTGRVIFISNMSQDKIEQAILSRSMCIDLTMSIADKLARMEWIVENSKGFMPQYPKQYILDSLALIKDNMDDIREFSLRSLEKVVKIRAGENDNSFDDEGNEVKIDWKELATFMLLS
jgi:hypothetical protein